MFRFAILTHNHPHLHWDFLVEHSPEETLKTWRLEQIPRDGVLILAEALPDHRRIYLDYEGPISGDRGEVKRWDAGSVTMLSETDTKITIQINSDRLQGTAELEHVKDQLWQFLYTASATGKATSSND